MRVVLCGECMVELRAAAGHDETLVRGFAGDTFNTAWYLAQLRPEWRLDYLTDIGSDAISGQMRDFIAGAGIGTDLIRAHDDATVGLYLIDVDAEGERSFSYWRGQSAARRLADDPERLERALTAADGFYLSGITLAILPPDGRETLLALMTRLRERGVQVAFDPNLRPALWDEPATMRAVVSNAAACADIVLPSHEDEATWFGDADVDATAKRYRALGAREVVVKNGSGAMLGISADETASLTPAPATVVDSTAAGDSFNAAYLDTRWSGGGIEASLKAGAALAAQVIGQPGALFRL